MVVAEPLPQPDKITKLAMARRTGSHGPGLRRAVLAVMFLSSGNDLGRVLLAAI